MAVLGKKPAFDVLADDKLQRAEKARQKRRLNRELFSAAAAGQNAEICRLLKAGANRNARDRDGWTLLMVAALESNVKTCALLILKGADIYAKSRKGKTISEICDKLGIMDMMEFFNSIRPMQESMGKKAFGEFVSNLGECVY